MARWLPGQSGNIHGRPKRRSIQDEVQFRLAKQCGRDRKLIAQQLIERAKGGTTWAIKSVIELDCWFKNGKNPIDPSSPTPADELTPEQRLQRLADLLSNPDLAEPIKGLLAQKPEAVVQ